MDNIVEAQVFDPDGSYVRQWLPALARLPVKYIHKYVPAFPTSCSPCLSSMSRHPSNEVIYVAHSHAFSPWQGQRLQNFMSFNIVSCWVALGLLIGGDHTVGFLHRPWEAPEQMLADAGVELGVTYPYPVISLKESEQHLKVAAQVIQETLAASIPESQVAAALNVNLHSESGDVVQTFKIQRQGAPASSL